MPIGGMQLIKIYNLWWGFLQWHFLCFQFFLAKLQNQKREGNEKSYEHQHLATGNFCAIDITRNMEVTGLLSLDAYSYDGEQLKLR